MKRIAVVTLFIFFVFMGVSFARESLSVHQK